MGLHRGVGALLTSRRSNHHQRGSLAICFRSTRVSRGEVSSSFRLSVRRRLWRALARAVNELAASIDAVRARPGPPLPALIEVCGQ